MNYKKKIMGHRFKLYGHNIMMSNMHPALTGALLYTAVMAGMNVYSGAGLDPMGLVYDGALMGASLMANEAVHRLLELEPSTPSSAAATGASFAALQAVVRGDQRFVRNVAAGGLTDVATEYWVNMGSSE